MDNQVYVTINELNKQIFDVEGVEVDVMQFASRKRRILHRLRYPEYPYKTKFQGPIEALVTQRIVPIIQKEIVIDEEDV